MDSNADLWTQMCKINMHTRTHAHTSTVPQHSLVSTLQAPRLTWPLTTLSTSMLHPQLHPHIPRHMHAHASYEAASSSPPPSCSSIRARFAATPSASPSSCPPWSCSPLSCTSCPRSCPSPSGGGRACGAGICVLYSTKAVNMELAASRLVSLVGKRGAKRLKGARPSAMWKCCIRPGSWKSSTGYRPCEAAMVSSGVRKVRNSRLPSVPPRPSVTVSVMAHV
mmetsp:Transcript_19844/g.43188  ORF Transcript_19844/g.43188 Transcript_19844/m.43188 type:complete len:223 (+) Transcript_19844:382-1050(+)